MALTQDRPYLQLMHMSGSMAFTQDRPYLNIIYDVFCWELCDAGWLGVFLLYNYKCKMTETHIAFVDWLIRPHLASRLLHLLDNSHELSEPQHHHHGRQQGMLHLRPEQVPVQRTSHLWRVLQHRHERKGSQKGSHFSKSAGSPSAGAAARRSSCFG